MPAGTHNRHHKTPLQRRRSETKKEERNTPQEFISGRRNEMALLDLLFPGAGTKWPCLTFYFQDARMKWQNQDLNQNL